MQRIEDGKPVELTYPGEEPRCGYVMYSAEDPNGQGYIYFLRMVDKAIEYRIPETWIRALPEDEELDDPGFWDDYEDRDEPYPDEDPNSHCAINWRHDEPSC